MFLLWNVDQTSVPDTSNLPTGVLMIIMQKNEINIINFLNVQIIFWHGSYLLHECRSPSKDKGTDLSGNQELQKSAFNAHFTESSIHFKEQKPSKAWKSSSRKKRHIRLKITNGK